MAAAALALTVFVIPFRLRVVLVSRPLAQIYTDYTDLLLYVGDILLGLALALWLGGLVLEPRRIRWGPPAMTVPILVLTLAGLASVPLSVDRLLSAYHAIRFLILLGLYLYIVNEVRGLGSLILPVAAMAVVQSVVGVGQVLEQHSVGLLALGELQLDPAWKGVSVVISGGLRWLRAYGLSDHPNILGGGLAFGLVLLAGWHVRGTRRWGWALAIAFAVGALGLFLTFSRTAWLAFAAGTAVLAILSLSWSHGRALLRLAALGAGAALVLVPVIFVTRTQLRQRLVPLTQAGSSLAQEPSLAERLALIQITADVFARHPLTGVGLGALPTAIGLTHPNSPLPVQPAHLAALDAAAESGVPGALAYLALSLAPWLVLAARIRSAGRTPELAVAYGLLLTLTVLGLFDYYTWLLNPGRLWQWLVWGLWASILNNSPS
jgi:O-antigen ligase